MGLYSLLTGGSVNTGTLVTEMVFAVCVVVLLGDLHQSVRSIVRAVAEALLVYALINVMWMVLHYSVGASTSAPSLPVLCLGLVVYACAQGNLSVVDRISRCATFAATFVLVISMTGVFTEAVAVLKRLWFGYAIPSVISYVAMLGTAIVLRVFSIVRFTFVPHYYILLIVATDLLGVWAGQSFIAYASGYRDMRTDSYASIVLNRYEQAISQVNIIVDISFLLLILVAYLMFYVLVKEHDERTELLVTKRNEADNASMARATRSLYESLREMRHEIKNHDAYMVSLVDAGEYGKLREFLSTYALLHEEATRYVASGNPLVDSVVNAKMALARSHGIEIETMLAVPSELPYEEDDIFCLLANLLDNAIEGTRASGLATGPIRLKVMPEAGYWFFWVENPCDRLRVRRNRKGELITSKHDDDVHGYGTRVIARIAEKYRGHASFTVRKDTFCASVMLAQETGREADDGGEIASGGL